MVSQRRALIVGGSMSGLLAGIMLRRRGWSVDIFERVGSELAGRGAGIVAQPELIAHLNEIGIDTRSLGLPMSKRKVLDRVGQVIAESECPQIFTSWERVYRVLRDAFPAEHYHRGVGLGAFQQGLQGVVVHLSDGRTMEAEICLPETEPLYAGYIAWRGLLAESAIPPAIHHEQFEQMTFCLPPGEQCLGYPVAGPDDGLSPGHRRYNVIWYRPADEIGELRELLTDDAGITHSISIPPPLIRQQPIAAMRAAAERLLAPQFRAIVRLIDEPLLQPIYDLESPRLAFSRVAIVGDAAFVARPHVGAGVSKAADDAAALAQALDGDDVEAALRRFEAERLPVGNRIIERARHLGAYLQATQTAEERARSERHSIPKAVLAETAMVNFLYR
jgi:2-polyprenyl-6-methoxyphenol hydroxylase-like FAD-dependent oxidoreductase